MHIELTLVNLFYLLCWCVLILLICVGLFNIRKARALAREFREKQANKDRVAKLLANIEDLLTESQYQALANVIVLYGVPYLVGESFYKQGKITFQQFFELNYENHLRSEGRSAINADLDSALLMATRYDTPVFKSRPLPNANS